MAKYTAMSGGRRLGRLLGVALLLSSGRASAIGSAEKGDVSIDATGYVRLTSAFMHFPEPYEGADDEGLAAGVSRLILKGGLSEELSYELNLFMDLSRAPSTSLGGSFATAGSTGSVYRAKALRWQFWESGAISGKLGIDRFRIELSADPLVVNIGRFPINYRATNIFAPNDFFAPFGATAVNTIFKPGVDGLRLGLAVDELSNIEVVRVLGYRDDGVPSWARSALLARANTTLWDFEWAALGGKVAERWLVGGSAQGQVGPLMLRAEGHAAFADRDADGELDDSDETTLARDEVSARVAAGADISFSWHNAMIAAEYAFFSDGAASASDYLERAARLFPDDSMYLGQHYLGLSTGLEIIPILRASVTSLINLQDPSGIVSGALNLDVAEEATFAGGVLVPWGEHAVAGPHDVSMKSEHGIWPLTVFAETRLYF